MWIETLVIELEDIGNTVTRWVTAGCGLKHPDASDGLKDALASHPVGHRRVWIETPPPTAACPSCSVTRWVTAGCGLKRCARVQQVENLGSPGGSPPGVD